MAIGKFQSGQALLNSGQALLVVVLVMAVVLTIALSVASRTVSDINISTKQDESVRAFSAAEAGIEQSLLKGSGTYTLQGNVTSQDSFTSSVTMLVSGGTQFATPLLLSSGETSLIWLVEHNTTGALTCGASKPCFTGSQLKFCWGLPGTADNTSTTPALEVSVVYLTSDTDFATTRIARAAFDPNVSRAGTNSFASGSEGACTIGSASYAFSKTVDISLLGVTIRPSVDLRRGAQYARMRMLYNSSQAHSVGVSVTGAGNFPEQGSRAVSTGTSGAATRRLEVYQLFSDLPPVFDYAVFSGSGGIVK